jgi:peptide-methionine (S)-S-oxide reductase
MLTNDAQWHLQSQWHRSVCNLRPGLPRKIAGRHTTYHFERRFTMSDSLQTITLGGGCFWCTEAVYVEVKGIVDVESGYCNGLTVNPSYEQVCTGRTGHNEVVKLVFDPAQISVHEVLEIFFVIHDPTTLNRQGNDSGTQYRSGIYFSTPEHEAVANALIREMAQSGVYTRPIVTEVLPLSNYSAAEDYHQDFFANNPGQGYCVAVAAPKVAKFRKTFARLQKP